MSNFLSVTQFGDSDDDDFTTVLPGGKRNKRTYSEDESVPELGDPTMGTGIEDTEPEVWDKKRGKPSTKKDDDDDERDENY